MAPTKEIALTDSAEIEITTQTETALTPAESAALAKSETVIERGLKTFVAVGTALAEINTQRLYRATHATFEDYCEQRWGFSRARGYELMAAAEVMSGIPDDMPKPANPGQAVALSRIPEPERITVWTETWERTEGKPTAAVIHKTYEELREQAYEEERQQAVAANAARRAEENARFTRRAQKLAAKREANTPDAETIERNTETVARYLALLAEEEATMRQERADLEARQTERHKTLAARFEPLLLDVLADDAWRAYNRTSHDGSTYLGLLDPGEFSSVEHNWLARTLAGYSSEPVAELFTRAYEARPSQPAVTVGRDAAKLRATLAADTAQDGS